MNKLFVPSFFLLLISCNSNSNSNEKSNLPEPQTYQETKMTLAETENADPTNFLKVTGTFHQNLIDQWVVEGKVTNNATVATYKDVVLNIVYLSKTETELGRIQKTLYEFLSPNGSQDFKFKTDGFAGTAKVHLDIASAVAVRK